MPDPALAILFAPPLPPVRLEPGREAVLGRGDDCERPRRCRARPRAATRRCAWPAASTCVRDLGSTNGTFVNGERVEGERALQPRRPDRGRRRGASPSAASTPTSPVATRPPRGARATRTAIFELPGAASADRRAPRPPRGDPDLRRPPDARDGRQVRRPHVRRRRTARCGIWLVGGRPVHAEAEKTCGEEAAFAGLRLQHGSFRFENGPAAAARRRSRRRSPSCCSKPRASATRKRAGEASAASRCEGRCSDSRSRDACSRPWSSDLADCSCCACCARRAARRRSSGRSAPRWASPRLRPSRAACTAPSAPWRAASGVPSAPARPQRPPRTRASRRIDAASRMRRGPSAARKKRPRLRARPGRQDSSPLVGSIFGGPLIGTAIGSAIGSEGAISKSEILAPEPSFGGDED